jgi:hypothetical protein
VSHPEAETWLLVESGAGQSALNMALDQALLDHAPRLGRPVLRFYSWTEPAATFGYFQKIAEVEKATVLRPLVRRPTGGGLVPHDADWTYGVVFPPTHEWYQLRAEESYARVHQWIQAAFASLGTPTELAPCCRKELPGQCFAGHEKFDLLWLGRKIAGAAQRRTRTGLLIQGSVQPPPGLQRPEWEQAMRDAATRAREANPGVVGEPPNTPARSAGFPTCRIADFQVGKSPDIEKSAGLETRGTADLEVCATTRVFARAVQWERLPVTGDLASTAALLAAQKYSQEAYNRRR